MENPVKEEIIRDSEGKFVKGVSGNPAGRPKGKTIKERVLEWLEEHPEDMAKYVEYFVKENRDLSWQMLEGKPAQSTDLTTNGKDLPAITISGMKIVEQNGNRIQNEDTTTDSSQ